jgi:hypothetical protein
VRELRQVPEKARKILTEHEPWHRAASSRWLVSTVDPKQLGFA